MERRVEDGFRHLLRAVVSPLAPATGEVEVEKLLGAATPRGQEALRGVPGFLCDQSLGGLAPSLPGHRVPGEALRRDLVLLATDVEVLDQRIVPRLRSAAVAP